MPHPNKFKYLKAPTIQQIEAVVKKAGVSELQFERFNNIHAGAIKRARFGIRAMPAKHWHLFFEKTENSVSSMVSKSPFQTPKPRTKVKTTGSISRIVS